MTKKSKTKKTADGIGTAEVAAYLGVSAYTLRTYLRGEEFYPDGRYTSYGWSSLSDPEVKRLKAVVGSGGMKKVTKKSTKKSGSKKIGKKKKSGSKKIGKKKKSAKAVVARAMVRNRR